MTDTLGVDLGTSAIKIARFDEHGELIACVSRPYRRPQEHEVAFERIWSALADGARELITLTPDRPPVAAIGLASQTNSFALLAPDQRPLSAVYLWTGRFADREARQLNRNLGPARIARAIGMTALTGQLLAPKWRYLEQHRPEFFSGRPCAWLLPDLITHRLCGHAFSDPSLWSLTGLYDLDGRGWWSPMLKRLHLTPDRLPHLAVAGAAAGPLLPETARELLLPPGIPVAVGTLDHLAGAIGVGNLSPGEASLSMGTTSCVVITHARRPSAMEGGVVGRHPGDPSLWYALAWSGLSTTSLDWCACEYGGGRSLADLIEEAGRVPAGADGWQAHPRNPEDGEAGFDFTRLTAGPAERPAGGEAMRAVLECVTAVVRTLLTRASDGVPVEHLTVLGGGAQSDVWPQILANELGTIVARPTCVEASARGAATLAALAAGLIPSLAVRSAATARNFTPPPTPSD